LGIKCGREGLFAGCLGEPPAGLVDRRDARGGGEEDREDHLAGDLADSAEPKMRLAGVDGVAIDLGG
jgi:hypothetical protein